MWCHYGVDTVLLRWGCCRRAMPHSVSQTIAAAAPPMGDLSARRGQWRSDAAGAAQCGSGEAAFSVSFSFPIIPPSSQFLIFFCLSSRSLASFHILSFCFAFLLLLPLILLLSFSASVSISAVFPPLCYIWWLYLSARLDKLHRGCCCFSRQWPCQSWCQG